MSMENGHTLRGFRLSEFTDRNGVRCSLQKSSSAMEECVWLGCNEPELKRLVKGQGWTPVELPYEVSANTRMHLTQEMVAAMLPALQHFVETGELPPAPVEN